MNYPLISEYIEAIKSAEDNFDELSYLRPVLGIDGDPVMSVGSFSVVFKMKDERDGKYYAVKCFTKEQEGRAESYKLIADELEYVSSNYLTPIKYLEKELFVDTNQTGETEFPVLLMDWVEGKTLDKYLHDNSENKFLLELLAFQFCQMACWLLSQPFAHGDLKPDNILIKNDGSIVLVDYDGMYVPAMKGEHEREQGSPGFRHLTRLNGFFDEHIDDFPIALITMALKAFSIKPELLNEYCNNDTMFFTEKEFAHIHSTKAMMDILKLVDNEELCSLYGAFLVVLAKGSLSFVSPKLYRLKKPKTEANYGKYIYNQARCVCKDAKDKSKIDYNKTFNLFQKAAYLGNADAQCCLGCCFKCGYGTPVDYTEARAWYDKSSKNGCARALRHIAMLYEEGLGVDKDIYEALKWYRKAIEQDDKNSIEIMGEIFYYGKGGIPVDYDESFKWYKKAAEAGDSDGMWRLGNCYKYGNGVEVNAEKAFEWYKESANKGNTEGLWRLGVCFFIGIGTKKDYQMAVDYLKKSADNGNDEGLWRLGHCYEYGFGVDKNEAIAYSLYKAAAEKGSSEGQWRLGQCYRYGRGVTQDIKEALYWFKNAANQGHKNAEYACNHLKDCSREIYSEGCSLIKKENYKEAYEKFYSISTSQYGQFGLGECYENGFFVKKNYDQAAYWYKKAAQQGYADAQYKIGNFYLLGQGVNQDFVLAKYWHDKAANQGHNQALVSIKLGKYGK